MIMINSIIVVIDFKVFKTTSYSFFINDELCDISIKRGRDRYFYDFGINKKADTPKNRLRKKIEFRHLLQSLAFFGTMLVVVIIFILTIRAVISRESPSNMLLKNSPETSAILSVLPDQKNKAPFSYSYLVNNEVYNFELSKNQLNQNETFFAFPVASGDRFKLKYSVVHPEQHLLLLDQPTEKQLSKYIDKTVAKHHALNPGLTLAECECQIEIAVNRLGVEAIGHFFYQDEPISEYPLYNTESYRQIVSSEFSGNWKDQCHSNY